MGQGEEVRGSELLRYGAKRRVSTCVEKEQKKTFGTFLFFVREGGHSASAPHSVELQFHASTSKEDRL